MLVGWGRTQRNNVDQRRRCCCSSGSGCDRRVCQMLPRRRSVHRRGRCLCAAAAALFVHQPTCGGIIIGWNQNHKSDSIKICGYSSFSLYNGFRFTHTCTWMETITRQPASYHWTTTIWISIYLSIYSVYPPFDSCKRFSCDDISATRSAHRNPPSSPCNPSWKSSADDMDIGGGGVCAAIPPRARRLFGLMAAAEAAADEWRWCCWWWWAAAPLLLVWLSSADSWLALLELPMRKFSLNGAIYLRNRENSSAYTRMVHMSLQSLRYCTERRRWSVLLVYGWESIFD